MDSYENLILLCRVHHKAIDDQPNHYTVERLRKVKTDHERWVRDRLTDVEHPSIHDPISGPLAMQALTTGTAVWQLIDGSEAYLLNSPSDSDAHKDVVDLADEFLQQCRDYGDLHGGINDQGMQAVRDAQRELQRYVSLLAGHGLLVFGTHQIRSVPGYNPPVTFRVAVIAVVQADDPGIAPVDRAPNE